MKNKDEPCFYRIAMEWMHPMRNRLQSRDNGVLLCVDPLLDDERSANQIMAELGFVGKPVVFDKSRPFRWDKAGLRNAELLGKS